ncbi:hypothetical protein AZ32_12570 [Vibrio cholerae O1 biovar El Tor str. L-3226]|nr:hypothetical protein AZ32_12570 [Vibrio cholerae O1 biovar El Tor str. L-3226]
MHLEWFICAHGDKFSCCLAAIQVAWVCHFKTLINRVGKAFCYGHKKNHPAVVFMARLRIALFTGQEFLQFIALHFDVSAFRACFFAMLKNVVERVQYGSPTRCFRQCLNS